MDTSSKQKTACRPSLPVVDPLSFSIKALFDSLFLFLDLSSHLGKNSYVYASISVVVQNEWTHCSII